MYSYEMKSYPNLKTILLVEKFLSENTFDLFSKAKIIRRLDGKINNQTLSIILDYLESDNKIIQSTKGIQWIRHPDRKHIEKLYREGHLADLKELKKFIKNNE